jgi:7 transmembrane receptor (rhodopsin family)
MTEPESVATSADTRLDDAVVAVVNSTSGASGVWKVALLSIGSGSIVCVTVFGNVLVCVAVAVVRRLRTPSNLLVISLAITDLLVAVFVMPPAAIYEVHLCVCFVAFTVRLWASLR